MRRGNAHLAVLLSASLLVLSLPALALGASSGGGGLRGSPTVSTSTSTSTSARTGRVTASAGGMTITTTAAGFLSNEIRFSGSVDPSDAGRVIEIERLGHETGWTWAPTVQTRVRSDGSYSVVWQANHIGQFSIRPVLGHSAGGSAADGAPTVTMIVYRPAVATWYNQAGSTTACGVRLTASTLGVAHRTLPCGTKVAFYYHGRTLILPVIDRGPYGRADWDVTEAAAGRLGMKQAGIVTLGSASLPVRR